MKIRLLLFLGLLIHLAYTETTEDTTENTTEGNTEDNTEDTTEDTTENTTEDGNIGDTEDTTQDDTEDTTEDGNIGDFFYQPRILRIDTIHITHISIILIRNLVASMYKHMFSSLFSRPSYLFIKYMIHCLPLVPSRWAVCLV